MASCSTLRTSRELKQGRVDLDALLARSLWWFVRYSVDRIWWNLSGARACDTTKVEGDIRTSLEALGL